MRKRMTANEKMLSVKEAADRLGVSCDTVRRLIKRSLLRAWKLPKLSADGRKRKWEAYRVSSLELERFIEEMSHQVRRSAGEYQRGHHRAA